MREEHDLARGGWQCSVCLGAALAGFIGSPAMNFLPGQVDGETLRTPFGDAPLPAELKAGLNGGGDVIIGVRPEHFEDPAVAHRELPGMRLRAKVAVVESMGSELYAYFDVDTAARSAELTELARDAGLDEVPSHGDGEATQVVARLDAASRARAGEEVELALDTRQIKLFDSADGHALV